MYDGYKFVPNKKHLRLLKRRKNLKQFLILEEEGIERREAYLLKEDIWKKWRARNPEIMPDLSGADLSGKNLRYADLSKGILIEANLREALLQDANLSDADLTLASFSRANLYNANLSGANLARAHFDWTDMSRANLANAKLNSTSLMSAYIIDANLKGAKFVSADLDRTIFNSADLSGVDFQYASFGSTVLTNTDMTNAKNLETCMHFGPSFIDHRTIQKSGNLPLEFLRGCGLPDSFIEYFPSLLNEPIQFYSCFISYSNQDKEFAIQLHADLQNNGIRCWFAPVLNCKAGWAAKIRRERHIGDFTEWKTHNLYEKAFEKLINDLGIVGK